MDKLSLLRFEIVLLQENFHDLAGRMLFIQSQKRRMDNFPFFIVDQDVLAGHIGSENEFGEVLHLEVCLLLVDAQRPHKNGTFTMRGAYFYWFHHAGSWLGACRP